MCQFLNGWNATCLARITGRSVEEEAEARSDDEAGQALDATAAMADITVLNDGTLEELEGKLEEIWSSLK